MRILAAHPLRTGAVAWQETKGQWTLTVVCKATFGLEPGVSVLTPVPEDVATEDAHWDDDPEKSVHASSDLVPFKPHPEVMLVGSAFAPGGGARSVAARLVVGQVDKAVEVSLVAADGSGLPKVLLRADHGGGRGFGPIAWGWPERRARLHGRSWSEKTWVQEPLGDTFDPLFFQAAPADQRLELLRPDEAIVLEHLHPSHARLVTRLPGVTPRARVIPDDGEGWDLELLADTLWIDTNRGICTLTWRGQVPLTRRSQEGEIRVALEQPGRPPQLPAVIHEGADDSHTFVEDDLLALRSREARALADQAPATRSPAHALPFVPAPPGPSQLGRFEAPAQMPRLFAPEEEPGAATRVSVAAARGAAPSWLPVKTAAPPVAPAPVAPVALRPPVAPAFMAPPPPPLAEPPSASALRPNVIAAEPPKPALLAPMRPEPPHGLLDASNAAADSPARAGTASGASGVTAAPGARGFVELVWFDPARVAALRTVDTWLPLLAEAAPADDDVAGQRKDMRAVLAGASPPSSVESALADSATPDGALGAPLIVWAGELEFALDEVKTLEAMLGAAAPFAPADKKLREAIDLAGEVLKTPLGTSPSVAAGLVAQLRDAWTRTTRMVPADYLDTNTRRLLLEQRAYATRTLWNDRFVRGQILAPGGLGGATPVYLPATAANHLPLFLRFTARLVAEVFPQQDQVEASAVALRVVAVGRVVTARSLATGGAGRA